MSKTFYINFVRKAIVARDISFFDNIYFSYLHFLHLNLSLWARLYSQHFPIFHITHVKNIYSLQIQDIFVPLLIEGTEGFPHWQGELYLPTYNVLFVLLGIFRWYEYLVTFCRCANSFKSYQIFLQYFELLPKIQHILVSSFNSIK